MGPTTSAVAVSGLKVPPHALPAERAVLGGILLDNRALERIVEFVEVGDFYRDGHRRIYECILELDQRHEPVDMLTLGEALRRKDLLDAVGGPAYLASLVDEVPSAANIEHYARLVYEKSLLRRVIGVTGEILTAGYEEPGDVEGFLDQAESALFAVAGRKVRQSVYPIRDIVAECVVHIDKLQNDGRAITGVPTGFADLDEKLSGLHPGNLVILAARPSMGKTSLVLNFMMNSALATGRAVLFFSLEMGKEDLVMRLLSSQSQIDSWKLRTGKRLDSREWQNLTTAATRLQQARIFIDDSPGVSALEVRAKGRRLAAEHDLSLVIVDYLQLMRGQGRTESREREISEISRSLKALAKDLRVPVVALSQLNREVEKREDKRPQMGDLRESGAIEQDADVIMFIYRDEVYRPNTDEPGIAEILIRKHRNGPTGVVKLAFDNKTTRFENYSRREES